MLGEPSKWVRVSPGRFGRVEVREEVGVEAGAELAIQLSGAQAEEVVVEVVTPASRVHVVRVVLPACGCVLCVLSESSVNPAGNTATSQCTACKM